MKNFTLILACLIAGLNMQAAQQAHVAKTNYVPYHLQVNQPLKLDPAQAMKQNHGNAKSLEWLLLAERHDVYDDTTSQWNYSDSSKFGYDNYGTTDTEIYVIYRAGSWVNDQAVIYTYNNLNKITYGIALLWNNGNNTWQNDEDVTVAYDANNNPSNEVYRYWYSWLGNWRNSFQYQYTYDNNHNELSEIYQTWDTTASQWVNVSKYIYTYDANNAELTSTYQTWNATLVSWVNQSLYTYTNDANGNHTVEIYQYWDNGTFWENSSKYLSTYNTNNSITQYVSQTWDSAGAAWTNNYEEIYTYDVNNNETSYQENSWDGTNLVWVNSDLDQYTYVDGNKTSTELQQYWDNTNSVWVNGYKYLYGYDANFNETSYEVQQWSNSAWEGYSMDEYTYDANNNKIYELDQTFNTNNLTYENANQYFYYYEQLNVQGINEVKNQLNAGLYPNPSTGKNVTLTVDMEQAANVRVGLYDAQGKLVTTTMHQFVAGTNTVELNYNVSGGNYYIQVLDYNSGKSSVLPFVKQ